MFARGLAAMLGDYAGFLPGVVVTLVISTLAAIPVGRRLRMGAGLGWLLLFSVGTVLAATVTPSREALLFGTQGTGSCDLSRFGIAPLHDLRHLDETSLNVLLFVPLGLAVGLVPRSRARALLIVGAVMLPVGIELLQLVVTALDRQCQSADVVDNLTGLLPGLALGLLARWVLDRPAARAGRDGQDRAARSR